MENELYDLTSCQMAILNTEKYYKGSNVNNICATEYIKEEIDFDLFKETIRILVQVNDIFNFKLTVKNGIYKQYYSKRAPYNAKIVDLKDLSELPNLVESSNMHVFDIDNSEFFECIIFRLPNKTGGVVFNMHHLFADSWTLGLVANEIVSIYKRLLENPNCEIDSFPSYIDFIKSEKEYINSSSFEKSKNYWNSVFSNIPEQAIIPSSKTTIDNGLSCVSKRLSFSFDKEYMNKINEFCKLNHISIFNFFMAIYSIYIAKSSGIYDFVIGTPILNRTNITSKNTMGMFINTIPIRINLEDNLNFCQFSSNIAKNTISTLRHQKYSYQYILDDLRKLNPSMPSLYNTLISYQVTKAYTNQGIDYETEWYFNGNCADDINIHLFDLNDTHEINVAYDYKLSKYNDIDINKMHLRILKIINQVLSIDNINISDIEISTDEEKDFILNKINNNYENFNFKNNIIEIIEDIAKKYPNNIAIKFNEISITYKDLIKRVNKMSNCLLSNNIKQNSNIGILTSRDIDSIIGILAIIKINCTYVPIDPLYPIDRINYMINSSEINTILVTDETYIDKINNSKINIILILEKNYKIFSSNIDFKFNYNLENNLYIIFTSGSTGKPKGVTISHKNIMNLMFYTIYKTQIFGNASNNVLQFATMSFDVSYQEIFSCFFSGSCLVLITDDYRKNINKLIPYIIDNSIDTLFIPPAYLRIISENIDIVSKLSHVLKNIITAGEALVITPGIRKFLDLGVKIHNHYGPAETHVATTYTLDNTYTGDINVPIGVPISNANVYILDKNKHLCPPFCIGEICIEGTLVGNGYWHNDLATSQNFVGGFLNNSSKLYLTHDIGYFDYSGLIHFVGRRDFLTKINGFRIELSEIDNCICNYPGVKSSICVVQEDKFKKHIIAYFTGDNAISESKLQSYLSKKLPNYMIPSRIVYLDDMPLNNNGKIDRTKLAKVDLVDLITEFIEPSSETEKLLCDIWKKLFNVSKIGANYNFFDIGGDSLIAIKLCAIILEKFNVDINISQVFSHPVLTDLAHIVDNSNHNVLEKINKAPTMDYYPISSAQKRIYYACSMNENSILYNMCGGLLFDEIMDIEKIKYSFKTIIKNQDAFRTCFKIFNGNCYQIILDEVDFDIDVFNDDEKNINAIINNFSKPFNFENAPLLRVGVYYLNDSKTLIVIDSHHIIMDGTSLNILVNDFYKLYNEKNVKKPKLSYIDYSFWENDYLKSNEIKDIENYWISKFNDFDITQLNLPYIGNCSNNTFVGNTICKNIGKDLFNNINLIANKLGVSDYMVFLSAFYILLYKYTMQENITIGTPIANRNFNDADSIIGMFVNNVVLADKICSYTNLKDFILHIKGLVLDALEYQPYPYDLLSKKLNNSNLFDVMFVYQNMYDSNLNLDNLITSNSNTSKFKLTLEIIPNRNCLNIEYCCDLFSLDFINSMFDNYLNILNLFTISLDKTIQDLDIISLEEKNTILNVFNNTKTEISLNNIIYNFENIATRNPDDIAIIFSNKKITYKALNEKANKYANYLLSQGIGLNDTICIMLERGFDLICMMLACQKIGACYVLIDLNLPIHRINYMYENSASKFIITTSNLYNKDFNNCLIIDNINLNLYNKNNLEKIDYENLCVIYTSGSTGNPKGVLLKNKSFSNLLNAFDKDMNISKFKNILSIATVSFDMFSVEIYSALYFGNTVILSNNDEQKDPVCISKLIIKYNVDFFITTPTRIDLLLSDNIRDNCLKDVKAFQLGGEVFNSQLYSKLKKYTNAKIYNGYGPTEITACCSNKLVSKNSINIGSPIANVQIYICDKDMNLCPIGVIGEICIGGIGVSDGYINNESATQKSFVKNPFGQGFIYKSGDLGKFNSNGEVTYIGRSDFQVKLHGLRIEVSEIEQQMNSISGIENSVVLCVNHSYLIGLYTSSIDISSSFIKQILSNNLPTYMIPRKIVKVDSFPINNNGKIDRLSLTNNISSFVSQADTIHVAPTNDIQKLYCDIWEKLLNTSVGIDDDLFELGADSLLAIKFKIELLSHDINISYADVFKYKTIRKLSRITTSQNQDFNLSNYDYDRINELLNNAYTANNLTKCNNSNVLLLGGNGYVGMHILNSYIKNNSGNIYCIVRPKDGESAIQRFIKVLHFYFNDSLDKYLNKRIFIIEGDILENNFGLSKKDYINLSKNVDVIINSAANVKHFGDINKFNNINIDSLNGIIKFCLRYKKRLIHISSLSVSGNTMLDGTISKYNYNLQDLYFSEKNLYIKQSLDNVYTKSKFEAEKIILENIINNNLHAQILRLGNITSRYSDGKFQINPNNNAFANRLKGLIKLKKIPDYLLDTYLEFTPVDECANCIINILNNYFSDCYIYHVYNNNHVYIKDFVSMLYSYGINVDVVSTKDFSNFINKMLKDENKSQILSGFINDFDTEKKLNYSSNIKISSEISNNLFNKTKFHWNKIDYDYLRKYLDYLKLINYLD